MNGPIYPSSSGGSGHYIRTLLLLAVSVAATAAYPQDGAAPKERRNPKSIRGYEVQQAKIQIRRPKGAGSEVNVTTDDKNPDGLDAVVQLGEPGMARITPLGLTFEIPVSVAPLKKGGHVDFLTFEDVSVNGTRVSIEDYYRSFDLPTRERMTLPEPVRVYIRLSDAVAGALDEWNDSKPTWPVSGRVYIFGRYKKYMFKFKRVVPVEFDVEIPNPLRGT
jgi:hypothetical protein